jgi:CO/xanthine dehydrogenase FAD-binding subunit
MYLRLEDYHRPDTLEACLGLLTEPDSAVIAGGTRLNAADQEEIQTLVDIQELPLHDFDVEEGQVRIGALVTLAELAVAELPDKLAALALAALEEKNLPLRNRSTLGGRLSHASSTGRIATSLLALGAKVEVASSSETETLDLVTWLARSSSDRRLLKTVLVRQEEGWSGYQGFSQPVLTPPACDVALFVGPDGARVASGGHAAGASGTLALPGVADRISWIKKGQPRSEWEAEVRKIGAQELPEYSNALASGDWRCQVALTLIIRLTEQWIEQGGGA